MVWNGKKIGRITFLTQWHLYCSNINLKTTALLHHQQNGVCFHPASTAWFLFCSVVNNMAFICFNDNWQQLVCNGLLHDFWRGCVNLHTQGHINQVSTRGLTKWLTRQGTAMIIAMIRLGSHKNINTNKSLTYSASSDRTSKWNTKEKVLYLFSAEWEKWE